MTHATPPPRPHRAWCVLAVAAVTLACLAPASAESVASAALRAQSASLTSATVHSGTARLLHLRHDEASVPDVAPLEGVLQAASLTIDWYHEEQYVWRAQGAGGEQPDPASPDPSVPAKTHTLGPGELALAPSQAGYIVNAHFPQGASVDTTAAPTEVGALGRAQSSRAGIGEAEAGGAAPADQPDGQVFTSFRADIPQVHSTVDTGSLTLTLHGDGILEVVGLDLQFTDVGGNVIQIHTGTTLTPVQTGPNGDGLYKLTTDFARLSVQGLDGSVELQSAEGTLQLAMDSAGASSAGDVRLREAGGSLTGADGAERTIPPQDLVLEGGNHLLLVPLSAGLLDLDVTGPGATQPAGVRSGGLPAGWPLAVLGVFVALAALAFAVLAMVLHTRRAPSQVEVESALLKGQFDRAANLAGRILKAKPGLEDAVISRAIALAKQGRPERVVAELTAHLGTKDPSDGVVHYVLGLAYLDLGRRDQAYKALQEAVRRTPALLNEASSRIGQPLSPERVEAHGYA